MCLHICKTLWSSLGVERRGLRDLVDNNINHNYILCLIINTMTINNNYR